MKKNTSKKTIIVFILLEIFSQPLPAAEIRIAVAANFTVPLKALVARFEQQTGHQVVLASGSTGKHFAQIKNGAPFEVFFAADVLRPQRLEEEGIIIPGSRFTYAIGKLVLWSPTANYVDKLGKVLERSDFKRLAIANPRLAPYGMAAEQVLRARSLWHVLQDRIVRGENISQTFHFVVSGNSELGFIALSQISRPNVTSSGSYWVVPQSLYRPLKQQVVLLNDNNAARSFLSFITSSDSRELIKEYGYDLP